MRTLAAFPHLVATAGDGALHLEQYGCVDVAADIAGARVRLSVQTDYPWNGEVKVRVVESGQAPWSLQLRQPAWADGQALATFDDGSGGGTLARRARRTAHLACR